MNLGGNSNRKAKGLMIMLSLILIVGVFLLMSYFLMLLWNSSLQDAVEGGVKKIDFKTAMGLMILSGILFGGTRVVA